MVLGKMQVLVIDADSARGRGAHHGEELGWCQVPALILPDAQFFPLHLLVQLTGVSTDGENCGCAPSHHHGKKNESARDHSFLT